MGCGYYDRVGELEATIVDGVAGIEEQSRSMEPVVLYSALDEGQDQVTVR